MATSAIHYKLKSSRAFETLHFEGSSLTLSQFKDLVMKEKKFRSVDLEVTDRDSGKVIENLDHAIPKNSSLVIRRVPIRASLVQPIAPSFKSEGER
ncbi:hypothetical protein GEMRC1_005299 [Eukaryota sp. GEM-RC1]